MEKQVYTLDYEQKQMEFPVTAGFYNMIFLEYIFFHMYFYIFLQPTESPTYALHSCSAQSKPVFTASSL